MTGTSSGQWNTIGLKLNTKGNRCRGTRWWRQILDRKWKYGRFAHAQWKICHITLIYGFYGRIAEFFTLFRKSGSRNTIVTSDLRAQVEIRPFRACVTHTAIIIGTVRSLWTWLWGRYHVPQTVFLVYWCNVTCIHIVISFTCEAAVSHAKRDVNSIVDRRAYWTNWLIMAFQWQCDYLADRQV